MSTECGILLKNGLVADGTGTPAFPGDVLIADGRIEAISRKPLAVACPTLDCTGKVVAPGFIDAHSHMDWFLPLEECDALKAPFIAQGCTTFVGGNCGFGTAGFRRHSAYRKESTPGLFPSAQRPWDTMAEYAGHVRRLGMSHNLAVFAGHGTIRVSMRGMDSSPLSQDEMKELLALLEQAMEEGALGVSLGLQYAPGLFAPMNELEQVARLVQRKGKILAVHGRAYSVLSSEYPLNPFGVPHNLRALREMLNLARRTGVRLQYSHLIFAGTQSHGTWARCLAAIDEARAQGVDVHTDSYPYHCGNSVLGVIMPKWFRAGLPGNYRNPMALLRLRAEFAALSRLVGLSYPDIQITSVTHPEFKAFEGLFLTDIAQKLGCHPFKAYLQLAEKSGEQDTHVLLHNYSTMEIIDALMQHPACLFMTDALPERQDRNPATYGSFPRFLQYARERKRITLEQAIRKMTGATADRFGLKNRGYIQEGMAADIAVFDWNAIADKTTALAFDQPPAGIEDVFMNGKHVFSSGVAASSMNAGVFLHA